MNKDDMEELRRLHEEQRQLKQQIRHLKGRKKPRKKAEFSKLHLIAVYLFVLAVTVFSCRVIWETKDTSALAYLIPSAFGLLTAVGGFYSNKAKRENEIKLRKQYGAEIYKDTKEENDLEIG